MASAELTVLDNSINARFRYSFAMAKGDGTKKPGWYLREHLANQRLSIRALGERLGLPYQTVWRYANASRQPKRETEAQIERAMQLPETALRKHPDESGEAAFLAGLSPAGQEAIKSFAAFERQREQQASSPTPAPGPKKRN